MFVDFILKGSHKSFSNNRFFFIMVWINFFIVVLWFQFIRLLQKSLLLSTHVFFDLWLDSSKIVWNALVIGCYAYLLKISITHNKNQVLLLYLVINSISPGSGPQMLSLKKEYTLRFLVLPIINLCNCYANWGSQNQFRFLCK